MENIPQEQTSDLKINKPKNIQTKISKKIQNNRSVNQNIYLMFLQKRYQECNILIRRFPEDQFKLYVRALIQKNMFHLQNSLNLFNQCQMLNRSNFNYLKHIAKNFFLLGKFKSSLQAAKDAMKLNSNDPQLSYILGKISLALKDQQNALTHLKLSVSKEKNEESYIQQAKIYIKNDQMHQAIAVLKQSIQFSSQNPQVYQMMGQVYSRMGKKQLAISNYKLALQNDSLRYNSLLALGSICQSNSQVNDAFQYFKKAYKVSPNSAALWNNIGIHLFQKDKIIGAYSCFKRALFLDPFRWDVHANISLLFIKKNKFLQAEIHLKSAIKLKKDSCLFNLWGLCLKQLKDFGNAEKAFQEALKLQTVKNQIQQVKYNLMLCLLQNQKKQQAKYLYEQLLKDTYNPNMRSLLLAVQQNF